MTQPVKDVSAEEHYQSAIVAWNNGNRDNARLLMRQAIHAKSSVAQYHATLAMMLKGAAPPQERAALYRRALELDPADAVVAGNLASVLCETQDYQGAQTAAQHGLSLAPQRAETWLNLGTALAGQLRWTEAAQAFDTALQCQSPPTDLATALR